ncbi:MAG: 7-cyano-7-deazaguanine synthase, partial [Phycisphaerae bacterium]|nr:7-cyano-7-deazaguanine synthase [Phycisphaerae bacterium]
SCYNPAKDGKPCGRCDSCRLRLKGFAQARLKDPLKYAER